jgi:hypothetical protein
MKNKPKWKRLQNSRIKMPNDSNTTGIKAGKKGRDPKYIRTANVFVLLKGKYRRQ